MERCDKYTDKHLLDYWQDQMEETEQIELQFHLAECVVCREQLRRMRELSGFLEVVPRPSPFSFIFKRADRSLSMRRKSWRVMTAVSCLLLALGIGFYYWSAVERKKLPDSRKEVPAEIRESPIYHSIDTLRNQPDSLRLLNKEKKKNK